MLKAEIRYLMVFILLVSSSFATQASANTNQEKVVFNESIEVMGEAYTASQVDDGVKVTTTIIGAKDKVVVVRDKVEDEFISVASEQWTLQEEKIELQKLNQSSLKEEVKGNAFSGDVKGNWVYGKWRYYTIEIPDKAAAITITALLCSYIPYIGKVVGAIASLVLIYGVDTGYFGAKRDYKLLNANYMMEKQQLKMFEKSNYTKLIKNETKESASLVGN
ncbi:hypothetical protein [Planomicrobium sp. CPCC 101079]|uniref:hypothetical protein n=1 Tax=Planomicrobium sp. CPCC 101079 TaxID=2599618 RepID=UPI0011B4AEEE|nr:hypothetical protein [Planomicrobium sp. CPCC 101079]TWT14345.1 hypothetical protein FQV28_01740 [Planomicrobium sp. CPCC 101079]